MRIGFCTDLAGPYRSVDGPAGAEAIRMAIADGGGEAIGRPVELLVADHRNDPDEAARIATRWFERDGVDMVVSGVNSDTSLAITGVAARLGRLAMVVGAGTTVQTRERAAPTIVQYAYDTAALARVPALGLLRRGLKRWFFVTADYPFGRELEAHGTAALAAAGGAVAGSVRNPHGADDFTPFVRQALDSGAEVLGLANGHAELLKAMAALDAMGARDRMTLVGLLTFIDDIHAMGTARAEGLYLADSWFWTRDADSRAWANRFHDAQGRMPSSLQAADWSAATQYLRAVAATGSADAEPIMRYLRGAELDDMYVRNGRLRADGTLCHDMYLLRVKAADAAASPWDVYDHVATLGGEQAFG